MLCLPDTSAAPERITAPDSVWCVVQEYDLYWLYAEAAGDPTGSLFQIEQDMCAVLQLSKLESIQSGSMPSYLGALCVILDRSQL